MITQAENHVSELLPDYVLDVLTDEETNRVAEHLAVCQACQDEYHGLQLAADELPLALAQTVTSPGVKSQAHGRDSRSQYREPPVLHSHLFGDNWEHSSARVRLPGALPLLPCWLLGIGYRGVA